MQEKRKFKIILSKKSKSQLLKLDYTISNRIITKLEYFEKQRNPFVYAKKLKDRTLGQYRFRIGGYRILFDVNDEGVLVVLYILSIKHRKDVYLC